MSHDNNSRQPGRGSRNPPTNRHPGLSSVGGPRRPENESVPPSEPPPFATLAPLGHALPQPGAEGGSGTAPPSYATRPPAGRSVQFRLPTLSENTARTGGPATTRTNARTMPAASRSVGGGAMTSTRRGTSIRPSRYDTFKNSTANISSANTLQGQHRRYQRSWCLRFVPTDG